VQSLPTLTVSVCWHHALSIILLFILVLFHISVRTAAQRITAADTSAHRQ